MTDECDCEECVEECKGCGAEMDNPWHYCVTCTSILLDVSRGPKHRLNDPEVIDEHLERMAAWHERNP